MNAFFDSIVVWFASTHLNDQIKDVDIVGLFTNPWFIAPFGILLAYMLFKQQWSDIIIIGVAIAVWWVSGTEYMDGLIVSGEIQVGRILPVVFGGAAALGLVIYLLFGRSD